MGFAWLVITAQLGALVPDPPRCMALPTRRTTHLFDLTSSSNHKCATSMCFMPPMPCLWRLCPVALASITSTSCTTNPKVAHHRRESLCHCAKGRVHAACSPHICAQAHEGLLLTVLDLHRKELKILVRQVWSTASATAKEPLHVHSTSPNTSPSMNSSWMSDMASFHAILFRSLSSTGRCFHSSWPNRLWTSFHSRPSRRPLSRQVRTRTNRHWSPPVLLALPSQLLETCCAPPPQSLPSSEAEVLETSRSK